MAFAGGLLDSASTTNKTQLALVQQIFIIQLTLNLLWTVAFVILKDYNLALAIAALLFGIVWGWFILAMSIDVVAGVLILPLAIWLTYALYLTYQVTKIEHN